MISFCFRGLVPSALPRYVLVGVWQLRGGLVAGQYFWRAVEAIHMVDGGDLAAPSTLNVAQLHAIT